MKFKKKMNGLVARECFYGELSWSHNKVPSISAYFEQLVLRGRFWKALVTYSGLKPNLFSICYVPRCITFKAIKNSILNANKIAFRGSVITGTFEKRACTK